MQEVLYLVGYGVLWYFLPRTMVLAHGLLLYAIGLPVAGFIVLLAWLFLAWGYLCD